MADDPKAGTASGESGAAAASANPPGAVSETDETRKARIAELEAQLDETRKRYENEHNLRLSHQEKVEQANQVIRQGGLPPTPSPLDQEIADLEAVKAEYAAKNISDPATNRALRTALQERDDLARNQRWQIASEQARADIGGASVSDEAKGHAWRLFQTGQYLTGAAALAAAKGGEADALREELEKTKKDLKTREADVLARQALAPGSPRGAGGGPSGTQRVKVSDYAAKLASLRDDPEAANQYVRDKDAGKFVVVADGAF
jgi:hypothetical protein